MLREAQPTVTHGLVELFSKHATELSPSGKGFFYRLIYFMTFQGGNPGPRDMAFSNMSTIYDLWTTDGGEFVAAVVLLGKFEFD